MQIVNSKELAVILNVNVETVRRMVKRGEIPFFKVGEREYRFDVQEVIKSLKDE